MTNSVNFDDYLRRQLQDPEFKEEFENENTRLESAIAVASVRKEAGLTQRELARVSKVPQSTIARIETGANTLGKKLIVSFS
ncbi:MAG: helix-turn-helix transcriptional regulator [Lactobacillus sp.]